MKNPSECALCGKDPAGGQATVYRGDNKIRLCHDDGPVDTNDGRTCYQKWRLSQTLTVEQDFYPTTNNGRNA
jgi:hypothetical protein